MIQLLLPNRSKEYSTCTIPYLEGDPPPPPPPSSVTPSQLPRDRLPQRQVRVRQAEHQLHHRALRRHHRPRRHAHLHHGTPRRVQLRVQIPALALRREHQPHPSPVLPAQPRDPVRPLPGTRHVPDAERLQHDPADAARVQIPVRLPRVAPGDDRDAYHVRLELHARRVRRRRRSAAVAVAELKQRVAFPLHADAEPRERGILRGIERGVYRRGRLPRSIRSQQLPAEAHGDLFELDVRRREPRGGARDGVEQRGAGVRHRVRAVDDDERVEAIALRVELARDSDPLPRADVAAVFVEQHLHLEVRERSQLRDRGHEVHEEAARLQRLRVVAPGALVEDFRARERAVLDVVERVAGHPERPSRVYHEDRWERARLVQRRRARGDRARVAGRGGRSGAVGRGRAAASRRGEAREGRRAGGARGRRRGFGFGFQTRADVHIRKMMARARGGVARARKRRRRARGGGDHRGRSRRRAGCATATRREAECASLRRELDD
eukprot:14302-Pelagococcus_subviridis.AAC.6